MGMEAESKRRVVSHTAISLGVLSVLVTLLVLPAIAQSSKKQLTVVRDDRQVWQSGAAARDRVLSEMEAMGVDVVQIFINWDRVAPEPDSRTKPGFNELDTSTYGSQYFSQIDAAVRSAKEKGIEVMINPVAPAPLWASTKKSSERFNGQYPNMTRWSRFVRAVAKRYSGRFDPGDGGGKVRPKMGSDKVDIQSGDGTNFATVKTVTVKKSRGHYFKTSVKRSGACNEKWRLQWVDKNGTSYTSRVASASNNK